MTVTNVLEFFQAFQELGPMCLVGVGYRYLAALNIVQTAFFSLFDRFVPLRVSETIVFQFVKSNLGGIDCVAQWWIRGVLVISNLAHF